MKRRFQPKPIFWIALTAFVLLTGLVAGTILGPASASTRKVDVVIPRGASLYRVGRILEKRRVISSAVAFRVLAKVHGDPKVEAGTYRLSPSMSPGRILKELRSGGSLKLYRITIPEGFTLTQIAQRATEIPGIEEDAFKSLASGRGLTFSAPFAPPANLEGYLYPDTYDFPRGTTDRVMVQAMLDNFQKRVVEPLSDDIKAAKREEFALHQILTIASLIEREARVPTEQPVISGVIRNRLKRNMPLQIDATVQYVIGHRERLLYRDLEVDSPYNTYKTTGLPPGPICNPGLGAIQAALHPADVPHLYYTANPDGTHTFTETLDEHVRATGEARSQAQRNGG